MRRIEPKESQRMKQYSFGDKLKLACLSIVYDTKRIITFPFKSFPSAKKWLRCLSASLFLISGYYIEKFFSVSLLLYCGIAGVVGISLHAIFYVIYSCGMDIYTSFKDPVGMQRAYDWLAKGGTNPYIKHVPFVKNPFDNDNTKEF